MKASGRRRGSRSRCRPWQQRGCGQPRCTPCTTDARIHTYATVTRMVTRSDSRFAIYSNDSEMSEHRVDAWVECAMRTCVWLYAWTHDCSLVGGARAGAQAISHALGHVEGRLNLDGAGDGCRDGDGGGGGRRRAAGHHQSQGGREAEDHGAGRRRLGLDGHGC